MRGKILMYLTAKKRLIKEIAPIMTKVDVSSGYRLSG